MASELSIALTFSGKAILYLQAPGQPTRRQDKTKNYSNSKTVLHIAKTNFSAIFYKRNKKKDYALFSHNTGEMSQPRGTNRDFGRLPAVPHKKSQSSGSLPTKKKRKLAKLRKKQPEIADDFAEADVIVEGDQDGDDADEDHVAEVVVVVQSSSSSTDQRREAGARVQRVFAAACVAAGLCSYLASANGGGKDDTFIKTLVQKVLDLLRFTKFALDGTDFNTTDDHELAREAWSIARALASDNMAKISEHLEDLRIRYDRKALTLRSYTAVYKAFFGWFYGWFPAGKTDYAIDAQDKAKLESMLKNLSSYYFKKGRKERRGGQQSIEMMVANRTWPENGFKDLMNALIPHIKRLLAMYPAARVTRDVDYNDFVKVMICCLYGHGVQGRIGGVKSILLSQARDLFEDGSWY